MSLHLERAKAAALMVGRTAPIGTQDEKLALALLAVIAHLEEETQKVTPSQERSATTDSATPDGHSDAGQGFMTLAMPLSLHQLMTSLPGRDPTHVEHCSKCAQLWNAFMLSFTTHAPAVDGPMSISQKPDLFVSAVPSGLGDVPSPSSGLGEPAAGLWRCPSPRCEALNYDRYDFCLMCHSPRPQEESLVSEGRVSDGGS